MSPRSTAVTALALMARGISAIGPDSDSSTTLTGEPQLVGSATSNGVLLYSFNYCTTVQTTACAVTVSTGTSPSPEFSTLSDLVGGSTTIITVAAPVSYPSAPGGSSETAAPSAANTDDSSGHWTPDPTITQSASPDVSIPATERQTSPIVVVIPTTDQSGSLTLLTTTVAAASSSTTDGMMTHLSTSSTSAFSSYATSSSGHSSSSRTTSSASSSTTRGASNATVSTTPEASSATSAVHAAPSKTGAGGSLHIIPVIVLGAVTFVAAIHLI